MTKLPYKYQRKRQQSVHTAIKFMGSVLTSDPSNILCLLNVGFGGYGGADLAEVESALKPLLGYSRLVMTHGKVLAALFIVLILYKSCEFLS